MSTLRCLACNRENKAGDKFCEACGSSLDLKFCPACEAVNGRNASRCHSCAAELSAEPAVQAAAPADVEPAEAAEPASAEQPFRAPLRWRVIEADQSAVRRAANATVRGVLALSLVALGAVAYHFYGQWSTGARAAVAVPSAGASAVPRAEPPPAPVVAAPPAEPIKPKTVPVAVAAPKRPAPETKPATPKRTAASVTHLRGSAPAPAPAPALPEPEEKTVLPASATAPSPAPSAAPSHVRVTHTRPGPAAPAEQAAPVAPATIAASTPAATSKPAASACPETVAVLGLCSTYVKREGN